MPVSVSRKVSETSNFPTTNTRTHNMRRIGFFNNSSSEKNTESQPIDTNSTILSSSFFYLSLKKNTSTSNSANKMSHDRLKSINHFMFFFPIHLPIHGQWWSISSIQQLQSVQCIALGGLCTLQISQKENWLALSSSAPTGEVRIIPGSYDRTKLEIERDKMAILIFRVFVRYIKLPCMLSSSKRTRTIIPSK